MMLYTWRLLFFSNVYIIFNLVSRAKIFELAAAIPWDLLQATHVLCYRVSITISDPDGMNEVLNLPRGIKAVVVVPWIKERGPFGGGSERSRAVVTTKITWVNDDKTSKSVYMPLEGWSTISYEPSIQTGEFWDALGIDEARGWSILDGVAQVVISSVRNHPPSDWPPISCNKNGRAFPNRYIIFKSSSHSPSMMRSRLPHERSFGHARPRRYADGRSTSISGCGSSSRRINLQRDGSRAVFWNLESMSADWAPSRWGRVIKKQNC